MASFRVDDVDIHYDVFGDGPAMLFMAGTAWPGTTWKLHQVPEFSRDHRVIVYDQRGTGASSVGGGDFSTERLAADAAALLDHLGIESAIVCGHSNGGRVAQMLALEHPAKVAKLMLLSSGATHRGSGVSIPMIVKLVELGYREYERMTQTKTGCSAAFYAANTATVDAFVESVLAELVPLEVMLRHSVGKSDTTSRLGEIRVSTLVVVGDDETHSVMGTSHFEFAKILAERLPNAELVVLPDEGHHYPFYSPEKTHAPMRKFLAKELLERA